MVAEHHDDGEGELLARVRDTVGPDVPILMRARGTSPTLRAAVATLGPTALLAKGGVEVLVATIRQQPIHKETFSHGLPGIWVTKLN